MVVLDVQCDRYHFLEPVRAFAQMQLELKEEKEEILERIETWLLPMIQLEDVRSIGSEDGEKVRRALEETVNTEKYVTEWSSNYAIRAFDVELHSVVYRYAEGAFRAMRKRLALFDKIVKKAPMDKQMRYHIAMGAVTFMESSYEEALLHSEKGLAAAAKTDSKNIWRWPTAPWEFVKPFSIFLKQKNWYSEDEMSRKTVKTNGQ